MPPKIDPDDYRDACDARHVLNAMGYRRLACKGCKRNTVVRGYICWNCHRDNSTEES